MLKSKLMYSGLSLLLLAISSPAYAYIGPGTGISAIGSFLALIAAVLVAILGFIWYPLKRLLRRFRGNSKHEDI